MNNQRQSARLKQAQHEEARLQMHARVAKLLRSAESKDVVRSARLEVERWRRERLCSDDYIDCWDRLLDDPFRAAEVLEERSSFGQSLRQNSPFAAYLR